VLPETRFFRRIGREAYLGQSTPHGCFLVREIIFLNFVTIMINQPQQTYLNMLFFTITVNSLLIILKKKKNKIGDQKNLLTNYIFLKAVVNNTRCF